MGNIRDYWRSERNSYSKVVLTGANATEDHTTIVDAVLAETLHSPLTVVLYGFKNTKEVLWWMLGTVWILGKSCQN